jgi:ABC-type antimicrobial peptide transport system permease subunit
MRNHIRKLFFSGFRHYLKANFWVALGVAISTAVLTGGLIVGDSVKHSLEQSVITRLGNVSHALTSGERYFTSELGHRLNQQGIETSAALRLEGMASANGGQIRLNNIQVWGLDNQFQNVVSPAPTPLGSSNENSSAFISENTAVRLNLSAGDPFLLRIEKGSLLPANAPFVSSENQSSTARFTVAGIIGPEEMGRLNLQNSQTAPFNVFIPIERLNQLSEMQGRANVLFINSEMNENDLSRIISNNWSLEDAGLSVIEAAADNKWELRSARVFMDDAILRLVENSGFDYTPILTYFANELSLNDKTTPYSFVSTLPDEELLPGEVVINTWLANDIDANIGDSLTIGYFEIGPLRELNEAERDYKIVRIEEIDGFFGDRLLMPEIPGLSDSESCRDWDTGVPVDLQAIRDKDEDYWYQYRGVPKAFIAYSQGAGLWGNRFGNATAYRFSQSDVALEELEERLLSQIDPFAFDIQLRNVRNEGLTAARQGTDFSSLFIGLSFFILVSGLLLTALLFVFNLEKRRSEMGTLSAIGFNKKTVMQLFLLEGLAISVIGGILGTVLAVLYNELVFIALNRVWHSIVRTDVLVSHYKTTTLLIGFALSVFVSLASIFIVLHRALKRNIVQLQRRQQLKPGKNTSIFEKYASISLFIIGFAIITFQLSSPGQINASYFFMAGGLFLFAAVLGASSFLRKKPELYTGQVNTAKLILQNLRQSRSRSLLVIILLAIGTYLVISTGMNRKDFYAQSNDKSSGTGGFLYWAESTVPVLHNLNDESYRNEQAFFEDFEAVHFHVAEGDDASCLNLNRISNPRILGVNSEQLNNRFSFQTKMSDLKNENDLWPQLKADFGDCIPAIADQTVIQWSLGKKAGDTLVYQNALGNEVKLLLIGGLAASVFQGNVIIDNSYFMEHFPTISGSNVFLIDGDQGRAEPIAEELDLAYRDLGWDMQLTAERLAMFNSIERTYLSIFLVLGALGLLIGTIGLAIVLQRTLLERKAEFSALSALGFKRKSIRRMVVAEFSILLTAGIAAGTISALISVFPSLSGNIDNISVGFVLTLMAIIVANGLLWIIFLAGYQIKRLNIVESLRNE